MICCSGRGHGISLSFVPGVGNMKEKKTLGLETQMAEASRVQVLVNDGGELLVVVVPVHTHT